MTQTSKATRDEAPDVLMSRMWRQGQRVDVGEFLSGFADLETTEMVAVLLVDQSNRWQVGERIPAENYLRRFPALEADSEAVVELAYGEFLLREEHDERPALEEFLWRFPEHGVRLRQQIELHQALAAPNGVSVGSQTTLVQTPAEWSGAPAVPGYEIQEELGRGGMGVVYKARQVKANRLVALKMILHGGHASPADLQRFRTEAVAIARLQHPNIVAIYEVDEYQGTPFFSMELCEGGSLDRQLAGTPLEPRKAAALVQVLAQAMHCAHQANVIHRDLKPANILLHGTDGTNRSHTSHRSHSASPLHDHLPKITDFGLAKRLDEAGQTSTGAILGTPSYMAPEQAGGKTNEIGPAVDVYALGAILYECLTGRPPFKAATPLDTILQVTADPPVPPSQLQSKTPRDLETICLKCLRKEPEKRYASAQELADDLGRWQAGEPIMARPAGRLERGWRWCRRKPALAAAGMLGVVVLVGILLVPILLAVYESRNAQQIAGEQEKTLSALELAKLNEQKAHEAERQALRQAAESASDSAQQLCERGEVSRGLLWFARALQLAHRAESGDVEDVIRWNLGAWSRELHTLALVLPHPKTFVTAVAFHPDGKTLVTGTSSGIVSVWDSETGQLTSRLPKLPGHVRSLVWHPGGKTLAIITFDGLLRLWEVGADKPRVTIRLSLSENHEYHWRPIAFHPDGTKILVGGKGPARVFDTRTGQPTGLVLQHGAREAEAVAWSLDGKKLLTGGTSGRAQVWDAESGRRLGKEVMTYGTIVCVDFSPDGSRFLTAVGWGGTEIRVWETDTGNRIGRPMSHFENNYCAVFSPDGTRIFSGNTGNEAVLWNVETGTRVGPPIWNGTSTPSVAYRPDGQAVLTGGNGRACVWKTAPGMVRWKAPFPPKSGCADIAFTINNREVLVAPRGRFDRLTGQAIQPFYESVPAGQVTSLALSPDERHVYGGSYNKIFRWEANTARMDRVFQRVKGERMTLSPDGKLLVGSNFSSPSANLLNAQTGKVIRNLEDNSDKMWLMGMFWSPDGKTLHTSNLRGLRLWDGATGEPRGKQIPLKTLTLTFSLHPKGHTLVVGTNDNVARQLDATSWKEVGPPLTHQALVRATAYSRDGLLILTTDASSVARIWHPATGKPIGPRLKGNLPTVSPDNRDFALAGTDGKIYLYALPARWEGEVEQITEWVEKMTGQKLNERGVLVPARLAVGVAK